MHPQAVPVAVEKIGKGQQGEPKFLPATAARTLLAFRCFCCHAAILTDAAHLPLALSSEPLAPLGGFRGGAIASPATWAWHKAPPCAGGGGRPPAGGPFPGGRGGGGGGGFCLC